MSSVGLLAFQQPSLFRCRAGWYALAAGARPPAAVVPATVKSTSMRLATAALAASAAVVCLALLFAASPGAGEGRIRESPPPLPLLPPDPRGEPLLASSHRLQCTPDEALG